ncbi:MAG: cupin domain-containing protein [Candidatus Thorarchaeota archaeon]
MNYMIKQFYTDIVKKLPKVKVPLPGVQGWVLQGPDFQVVFFEIEKDAGVPPHKHEAQFGMMLDGKGSITIGGKTIELNPGISYYIPVGTMHEASFNTLARVMDIFMESNRYETED